MDRVDVFGKVKKFDFSKWVVTKFYHYTSRATEVFAKYDPVWYQKPHGDSYVKDVYDHFQKCVDAYLNYPEISFSSLGHQNKTTIEIFNIETGEKLYVTQYDGVYSIGKDVYSEFGNVTDFGLIPDGAMWEECTQERVRQIITGALKKMKNQ